MIEKNPIREARLEFSRKTSALYPDWSSLLSNTELERQLYKRFRRNGKDYNMSLSGSPNHGLQDWQYDGKSPLFNISTAEVLPVIKDERWVYMDDLLQSLKRDTIMLFNTQDIRNAKSILSLPRAFTELGKLDELVTKDARNGIILVKP